jgi:type VI protein secretion system component VasK
MTRNKPAEADETPQPDTEGDASSVAQALGAVQKAMEELASLLGADPEAAAKALKEAGRAAADNLAELASDARDIGQGGVDELSDSVRRHPLPWLAAALGLGLIVGLWRNRANRT